MKKLFFILIMALPVASGFYLWMDNREVKVISVHHKRSTVAVLVDHLPLSQKSSIRWWLINKSRIFAENNIPTYEKGGPGYITIFAFGEGYQALGKEDRLCFDELAPPKNCIDKDILMKASVNREGKEIYYFDYFTYMVNDQGEIVKAGR